MALTIDQNYERSNLSSTSKRMLKLREVVLTEWETRVRASVEESKSLSHALLIDTFLVMYNRIVEALTPSHFGTSAAVTTASAAAEHGAERARLTHYEITGVISEFQILKSTILDVLQKHKVAVSNDEMQIIKYTIDTAIQESAIAFTLAQSAFREQFVAALAHDLRTPLGAASMAAQLIIHIKDSEKIEALARKIVENIGRVDEMVKDLLDTIMFQRGERLSVHPTHFDIADVVREVCEQTTVIHGLRIEVVGTSITGWWGRNAIKRMLENLIDNAIKYSARDTPIHVTFEERHGRMLLSVHNQGNPIPPEQVETMFQIFGRAKAAKDSKQKGWGIGLPYVRSVAESHGGSIDVHSEEERGTTFFVNLPLDSRPFQGAPTSE